MKLEIKRKAGLIHKKDGENPAIKSFGKCSYEELALAIQAAIEIGEQVNYPLS